MWTESIAPIQQALDAAREESDSNAIARCSALLGRAHHRLGDYDLSEERLVSALSLMDKSAAYRGSATRVLADIQLRRGDAAGSESTWLDALDLAIDAGSRDNEARARRGLAHLRAVQGRLHESGELLDQAGELLNPDGDSRVRAGVLARRIEIDTCAGGFGAALRKAELLVDLVRRREMSERLAEAYGLLAEALLAIGDREESHDAAHQALVFARAHGPKTWASKLRAARILCFLECWDEGEEALPAPEDLPTNVVDDPAAQLAAIRARLYARRDPSRARDLAIWALVRPPPLLSIRAARIAIDLSLAFSGIGEVDTARKSVKQGLKRLDGPGGDGLRLELLIAMEIARSDPRVLNAAGQVAARVSLRLDPESAALFRARPIIARALAHLEQHP
jgi:tetratricopeptide (TPR) repeat protein